MWSTSAVLIPAWIGAGILALDRLGLAPAREAGPTTQPAREAGPTVERAAEAGRKGLLAGPTARRIASGLLAVSCTVPCLALVRGADQALLVVSSAGDPDPTASTAGATHLGVVEGMALWLRPLSSR